MKDFELSPAPKLATYHAVGDLKPILLAFLQLDTRLAQFVSQAKEPMLTQMRIAWWRDQLGKPAPERPNGDPVLDSLSKHWLGEETALIAMVNGWEGLLAEPPLPISAALEFAEGRGKCFAAMARLTACGEAADASQALGEAWALADLAARMSSVEEREFVVDAARKRPNVITPVPYKLRALTILGKLGGRALQDDGRPLIRDRKDLLLVTRVGLFGR